LDGCEDSGDSLALNLHFFPRTLVCRVLERPFYPGAGELVIGKRPDTFQYPLREMTDNFRDGEHYYPFPALIGKPFASPRTINNATHTKVRVGSYMEGLSAWSAAPDPFSLSQPLG
jgi:hypothetical protein